MNLPQSSGRARMSGEVANQFESLSRAVLTAASGGPLKWLNLR